MDPITTEEAQEIRNLLAVIYGDQAHDWNINIGVLELFGELLQSNQVCSKYMDMVPRPYFLGNAIRWASKQARNAIISHFKEKAEKTI